MEDQRSVSRRKDLYVVFVEENQSYRVFFHNFIPTQEVYFAVLFYFEEESLIVALHHSQNLQLCVISLTQLAAADPRSNCFFLIHVVIFFTIFLRLFWNHCWLCSRGWNWCSCCWLGELHVFSGRWCWQGGSRPFKFLVFFRHFLFFFLVFFSLIRFIFIFILIKVFLLSLAFLLTPAGFETFGRRNFLNWGNLRLHSIVGLTLFDSVVVLDKHLFAGGQIFFRLPSAFLLWVSNPLDLVLNFSSVNSFAQYFFNFVLRHSLRWRKTSASV